MSGVRCHLSDVRCHLSPVTCHLSPVICHLSPITNANSHSQRPLAWSRAGILCLEDRAPNYWCYYMPACKIKVPQSKLIALVKFKFGRMFVFGFFPNFFVTCNKEIGYFFSIVCCTESLRQTEFSFVALSHCNKQNFCLSH